MDWLRVFIGVWAVVVLLSTAISVASIGKPRDPLSPESAGCVVMLNTLTFVGFLAVWIRLGA